MADWDSELSIFWGKNIRINIKIDISILIRSVTTKFGKQVLVTSLHEDHLAN